MTEKKTCFLCGIGGSGMSALARLLLAGGWSVQGSDRSRDKGETPEKFQQMEALGVRLFPQDGSGVTQDTDLLVVSSAVEDTIPDVRAAKEKNIPIRKRAEILAGAFNTNDMGIAIGGTSGKSTVTAMTGWVLYHAGREPTIVNGALMNNFDGSNAITGEGPFVAEVDESDGSIALFGPDVAVITNISLDHKSMDELHQLFGDFAKRAKTLVLNLDNAESRKITASDILTFSLTDPAADFFAENIVPQNDGVSFVVQGVPVRLQVPGRHNVANALAAMAAAQAAGVTAKESARALAEYKGIHRRFEIVGTARGVTVIDDFAHNPDKIAATLNTLHEQLGRVFAIFQPHGFGPTKLMRKDLVDMFAAQLKEDDVLVMPEIYYAGGTAARDISSADIVNDVAARGKEACFIPQRQDIAAFLAAQAQPGDRIVVMGARDDTLPAFAQSILSSLEGGRTMPAPARKPARPR